MICTCFDAHHPAYLSLVKKFLGNVVVEMEDTIRSVAPPRPCSPSGLSVLHPPSLKTRAICLSPPKSVYLSLRQVSNGSEQAERYICFLYLDWTPSPALLQPRCGEDSADGAAFRWLLKTNSAAKEELHLATS